MAETGDGDQVKAQGGILDLIEDDAAQSELRLQVGTEVVLDVQYDTERIRVRTRIRGWKEDGYIFVDTPDHEGEPLMMQKTGELTCRLISEGELVTFDTRVVRKILEPLALWCINYPTFTAMRRLRGDIRVPTGLPARIEDNDALIVDLGRGGARIRCAPVASLTDVGQNLKITFALPGVTTLVEIEGVVRSVSAHHLSVQFDLENVPNDVGQFVGKAQAVIRRAAPKPVG